MRAPRYRDDARVRDEIKQLRVAERTVIEFVEGENDAEAHGYAGAQTAGDGTSPLTSI